MRLSKMAIALCLFTAAMACSKASETPAAAAAQTPAASNDIPAPPDVAAPPADAFKRPSGLVYKVLKAGTGTIHPMKSSTFVVHYTGWTTDGKMFDSSIAKGGAPLEMEVGRVVEGWQEALQLMVIGDKWRIWVPQEMAYKGQPGSPLGTLVFDMELIDIK